jgi:hypothetical protein
VTPESIRHKLGEIAEHTRLGEWLWALMTLLVRLPSLWRDGGEETWPQEADSKFISLEDEAELKRHDNYVAHINFTFLSAHRFSTWRRQLRVTARVFQFVRLLRDSTTRCADTLSSGLRPLLAHDTSSATAYLLKTSRQQSFREEFACLRENRALPKKSRLYKISPKLGEDEHLLRAHGSIFSVPDVAPETRKPIILDGHNPIFRPLIARY